VGFRFGTLGHFFLNTGKIFSAENVVDVPVPLVIAAAIISIAVESVSDALDRPNRPYYTQKNVPVGRCGVLVNKPLPRLPVVTWSIYQVEVAASVGSASMDIRSVHVSLRRSAECVIRGDQLPTISTAASTVVPMTTQQPVTPSFTEMFAANPPYLRNGNNFTPLFLLLDVVSDER
jgi:hypothetical protein